jgi:septal ring factor EnvC (AmiA/AmiB activator)
MENQFTAPVEPEHEQPKSATEVVSDVLDKNTKNNHFLQNMGIKVVRQRRGLHTVEASLEVEKRKNADLRSVVDRQQEKVDDLSRKVQENQKKQAKLESKLELLLSPN